MRSTCKRSKRCSGDPTPLVHEFVHVLIGHTNRTVSSNPVTEPSERIGWVRWPLRCYGPGPNPRELRCRGQCRRRVRRGSSDAQLTALRLGRRARCSGYRSPFTPVSRLSAERVSLGQGTHGRDRKTGLSVAG